MRTELDFRVRGSSCLDPVLMGAASGGRGVLIMAASGNCVFGERFFNSFRKDLATQWRACNSEGK